VEDHSVPYDALTLMWVVQDYSCYCQPCVPTSTQPSRSATAFAKIGSAAFGTVLVIVALFVAAVSALAYKLKQASEMTLVSLAAAIAEFTAYLRYIVWRMCDLICSDFGISGLICCRHCSSYLTETWT